MFFSIIFGTRPEYLKLKPLIDVFTKEQYFDFQVIYVQQHENIPDFIEDNNYLLKKIQIHKLSNHRMEDIGIQILSGLQQQIYTSTHIIVQGDTATAFYSALFGFQNKIQVIHIEAGLRTYNLENPYPEEAYRQMISRIASIHFTPHNDCKLLLEEEKVSGKIYNVGNTILDLIKSYNLHTYKGKDVLITFHRRENWEHVEEFIVELNKLVEQYNNLNFIWYLHPNKELQAKVKQFIHPNVILEYPENHYNFSKMIASSYCLLTDSGGIQEEASFLGKQTIVLRKTTERNHIKYPYLQTIESFKDIKSIFSKIDEYSSLEPCYVYGKGDSSIKIYQLLKSHSTLL